jgi:hypothetical protein
MRRKAGTEQTGLASGVDQRQACLRPQVTNIIQKAPSEDRVHRAANPPPRIASAIKHQNPPPFGRFFELPSQVTPRSELQLAVATRRPSV